MSIITLSNGKQFECTPAQTILEAARVSGIALEHSCKTGRCGICKCRVLHGTTQQLRPEKCLCAEEASAGYILTCARTAVSDVLLDADDLSELVNIDTKTLPCRIDSLSRLAEDVIEVTLRTPPSSRLEYLPGQYIDVIGKEGLRRSYSIANAPRDDGRLSLQIRKVAGGELSRYWFDEAKTNDLLRLEGPLGTFFLRRSGVTQLILLATGTGIAPIRAMLEQLATTQQACPYSHIHLYWGGRTTQDLYWAPNYPNLPLRFVPVLSRSPQTEATKRYVQDAVVADEIPLTESAVYACGSEYMITGAKSKLIQAGLEPKNFFSDAFVSSAK